MELQISFTKGMVNIDADGISYGNIKGLYKTGDGHGLQLDERLEPMRDNISRLCYSIAKQIYELDELSKT